MKYQTYFTNPPRQAGKLQPILTDSETLLLTLQKYLVTHRSAPVEHPHKVSLKIPTDTKCIDFLPLLSPIYETMWLM